MFTGIIEETGVVRDAPAGSGRLVVESSLAGLSAGESISVNGACLTLEGAPSGGRLSFRLSPETLSRTTLGRLLPGERVNLERALRLSDRLGGHLVTGHVDARGRVGAVREVPGGREMVIGFPASLARYLVEKGSVAVEGVSLTVASVSGTRLSVALVAFTLERTSLGEKRPGHEVNLEIDILARYLRG